MCCAVQSLPTPSSVSLRELLARTVTSKLRGLEVSQDWKLVDTGGCCAGPLSCWCLLVLLCCAVDTTHPCWQHFFRVCCWQLLQPWCSASMLPLCSKNAARPDLTSQQRATAQTHPVVRLCVGLCVCVQVVSLVCTTLSRTWELSESTWKWRCHGSQQQHSNSQRSRGGGTTQGR